MPGIKHEGGTRRHAICYTNFGYMPFLWWGFGGGFVGRPQQNQALSSQKDIIGALESFRPTH
jgi:hypothetical protein